MTSRWLTSALCAMVLVGCGDPSGGASPIDAGMDTVDEPDVSVPDGTCTADIDCATGLCLDGLCQEVRCRPDELSCGSDQTVVRCNTDGQDFTLESTCDDGFRCHRGECREFVCEPRTIECEGTAQRICNETGTRAEVRPCGGQRICVRGQCLEPQCDDAEVSCQDARTRRVCEDQAYRLASCAGDEVCRDGACAPFFDLAVVYATAAIERPTQGAIALWIVPTAGLPGPELIVWGTLIVEVTIQRTTVVYNGQTVLTSDRPFEPGVPTHLVVTWSVGRAGLWRDGTELDNTSIPTVEGGAILEMSSGDWRLGSVSIGRAPTGPFVPTCQNLGLRNATVWPLDEGQGDHVFARDGTGMSLATPTWHAGVLPIYGIDRDDDGWGWIHETAPGCAPRDGDYVLRVGDCNDGDAGISPSAPEVPDGVDNDCDDEVDE